MGPGMLDRQLPNIEALFCIEPDVPVPSLQPAKPPLFSARFVAILSPLLTQTAGGFSSSALHVPQVKV